MATSSGSKTWCLAQCGVKNRKADKSNGRRTLCFQRLSKNVHKKHRNPTTCERSSARCRKLTKPDTYHSDLKRKEAYTAYSNPRGFIYQNKDKQNRLIRIYELHKFSDGTLNDVRTALDLKGIWMKYLPQAIWRKSDKERVGAMIQAIDKQLKTRRIIRGLEKFVGGRLYEGDFRMLQGTILFIIRCPYLSKNISSDDEKYDIPEDDAVPAVPWDNVIIIGNRYSRKRQKQSQKRQNQTHNGKDRERQSHLKPKVKSQSPRSTKVNPRKVKVNPGNVKVKPDKAEAKNEENTT
nr:hypothetical protein [Tanacetum cinerariifolium]